MVLSLWWSSISSDSRLSFVLSSQARQAQWQEYEGRIYNTYSVLILYNTYSVMIQALIFHPLLCWNPPSSQARWFFPRVSVIPYALRKPFQIPTKKCEAKTGTFQVLEPPFSVITTLPPLAICSIAMEALAHRHRWFMYNHIWPCIYLLKEWWIFFCLVQFTSLNRGVNRHWAWHFLTQPGPQLADVNIGVSGLVYGENMGKNNVNNGVVCWKKKTSVLTWF